MCLTPNLPEPQREVRVEMLIGCSGRYDYSCYVSSSSSSSLQGLSIYMFCSHCSHQRKHCRYCERYQLVRDRALQQTELESTRVTRVQTLLLRKQFVRLRVSLEESLVFIKTKALCQCENTTTEAATVRSKIRPMSVCAEQLLGFY